MILLRTMKNISSLNIVASVILFATAILAAVVANSSLAPVYTNFYLMNCIYVWEISTYFHMEDIPLQCCNSLTIV